MVLDFEIVEYGPIAAAVVPPTNDRCPAHEHHERLPFCGSHGRTTQPSIVLGLDAFVSRIE